MINLNNMLKKPGVRTNVPGKKNLKLFSVNWIQVHYWNIPLFHGNHILQTYTYAPCAPSSGSRGCLQWRGNGKLEIVKLHTQIIIQMLCVHSRALSVSPSFSPAYTSEEQLNPVVDVTNIIITGTSTITIITATPPLSTISQMTVENEDDGKSIEGASSVMITELLLAATSASSDAVKYIEILIVWQFIRLHHQHNVRVQHNFIFSNCPSPKFVCV